MISFLKSVVSLRPIKVRFLRRSLQGFHIDGLLCLALFSLVAAGLFILYSASNRNLHMMDRQILRLLVGFAVMITFAWISPKRYHQWAPWLFTITVSLLIAVLIIGKVDKGARRWLELGFFQLQPSEMMKLAMPMMLAYFFSNKSLPPKIFTLMTSGIILIFPVLLVAKQPDLGTAIIISASGVWVLFLAGMQWRLIIALLSVGAASTPILWHFMHTYQRERVLTFLNPERDPLGSGYHIIQSKIALGSGGIFGKGWLHGTQSHLQFLPAHATDFIFAVNGEETGLIGCMLLITILLMVFARSLIISYQAQDTFTRLLGGSLTLTFILSTFVNISMVIGILPVVGIPLPLVSYGGSAIVTTMASFGIIMSIQTHRKLWST